MTKKIFKRTYRVAFHPNVAKMIEGAKKGKTFSVTRANPVFAAISPHHKSFGFFAITILFLY